MTKEFKKLTVNLSADLVEVLKELAARDDTTMTGALKKAIEQRKYFVDKVEAGNEIQLIRADEGDTIRTLVDI